MPEFNRYFSEGGDEKFRYTYNLNPTDVVVDVGAYHGMWSKKIYDKYKCKVFAFEPVFHNIARSNLKNTNVVLNTVGLGNKNEFMDILEDSTSVYKNGDVKIKIQIRDFIEAMNEFKIDKIALLKINIEGGEYCLLEHLINNGFINKITSIQVQFHDFMADAVKRRNIIQEKLRQTHCQTYNFNFVWENWEINK